MTSFTNSQSFVQRTFPPIIGSLTSPSAEQICQKNNLSFAEILRPFCNLQLEHKLKDPSGNDHLIKQLNICIQDVNERPPQPILARKLLNDAVADADCDVTKCVPIHNGSVDIPVEFPWFRAWTDTFLQVQFPSEHEFTKHLLGCMLVTSTIDPPEALQGLLQSLQQMQATAPARLPKWFCPAIFKFYVLVHDVQDGDKAKALNFFNSLKTAYGADNCYFLEVNSRHQNDTTFVQDYWANSVVRRATDLDGSGASSSPRTPAELGGIGMMPTTVGSQSTFTDMLGSATVGNSANSNEEDGMSQVSSPDLPPVGQDVSPSLLLHPLSPDLSVNHFSIINDKPANPVINADVWRGCSAKGQLGAYLSEADINGVRSLVRNCVLHALLPHVEKQIYILNDFVSNKKGMSRSLLSATKRLFGSTRPGGPGAVNSNTVIYAPDAPELQLRRLGDLYFMFTAYTLAFQAYYTAKRELGADQAWLYYAGALEMAALSAFMQQEQPKKAVEYMEEAIVTYLNSCKMPQFATRATLLGVECLKDRLMFGEAAKQLIRMTSEDSDLRSALLLEQASYCFLQATKPRMRRKYAFHMVLAGHRFSKAGQKRHALRCYRQAFQVYDGRGWGLAIDHIHFTIGRLAGHLNFLKDGCLALGQLLTSGSKQTAAQQMAYLLEYLNMHQQLEKEGSQRLPKLPLPLLETNSVSLFVGSLEDTNISPDSARDAVRWARMEEIAVSEMQGASMIFRPTLRLFSNATLNATGPVLAANERVTVQVALKNPLQVSLPLTHLRLLWIFTLEDGRVVDNEQATELTEALAITQLVHSVLIPPLATHVVNLEVSPQFTGTLQITGVAYSLTTAVRPEDTSAPPLVFGRQEFSVRGPKLKPRRDKPDEDYYADDFRLHVTVVPAAPNLKVVARQDLCKDVLCGELETMQVELINLGNSPLNTLCVVSNTPQAIGLSEVYELSRKIVSEGNNPDPLLPKQYLVIEISLKSVGGRLLPGERLSLPFWVCAPEAKGPTNLCLLFYYTNPSNSNPRHRVSRLIRQLSVESSVEMSVVAARSLASPPNVDTDAVNLCVSAKNLTFGHDAIKVEISLSRLVLASENWNFCGVAHTPKGVTLQSQQTVFLVSQAYMLTNSQSTFSELVLDQGSSAEIDSIAKSVLLHRSSSLDFMLIGLLWKGKIISSSGSVRETKGVSLLPLAALDVVIPNANTSVISQTPSSLPIFGPDRVSHPRGKSKKVQTVDCVSCNLMHDDTIKHSFSKQRVCCANVTVRLRNSSDSPATIVLNSPEVAARPQLLRTHLYTPHAAAGFTWAGRSRAIVEVPGKSSRSVTLRAAVTSPGAYDVAAHLTVALRSPYGLLPLPAPPESPIIVVDS